VFHDGRAVVPPLVPTTLVVTRYGQRVCLAAIDAVESIELVWPEVIELTD
jgi:hypothetical protein